MSPAAKLQNPLKMESKFAYLFYINKSLLYFFPKTYDFHFLAKFQKIHQTLVTMKTLTSKMKWPGAIIPGRP